MNEDKEQMFGDQEPVWQSPPLPEEISADREPPEMSEAATLGNIFIEPGRTFEDLRRKPRFIFALIIICIVSMGYVIGLQQKLGQERMRAFAAQQIEKNPQAASMTAEQKENALNLQMTIAKVAGYALPVVILILFAIGSLIYFVAVKALGGTITYLQAVAVWVYSSFPPAVVSGIANFIVMFLKSPDEIDMATSQRGLIQANPTLFIGGAEMPVLTTLLSAFDFFAIWGLILAAIGLHKVGRISKGSAWAIALILTLVGITVRVLLALISGNPS